MPDYNPYQLHAVKTADGRLWAQRCFITARALSSGADTMTVYVNGSRAAYDRARHIRKRARILKEHRARYRRTRARKLEYQRNYSRAAGIIQGPI